MAADDLGAISPGSARCPGPSTRDVILADGWRVPEALVSESYEPLGVEDIPYDRYLSPEFFGREMDKVWAKAWQWACREEHIPEAGDYVVYDIGPYSVIVVRTEAGEIRAYHNSCLHRGTQFRRSDSSGSADDLRCPFHGWTWNLHGEIQNIPCRWDFPRVRDDQFRLPQVRVDTWGGFVWINLDDNAPRLLDFLGVLPEHFKDRWDLSRRHIVLHLQKELDTNWKAAMEAFLEAYHVMQTHAGGRASSGGWDNAQYDVFAPHVSRFIHTVAATYPDNSNDEPFNIKPLSERETFARMRRRPEGEAELPEGRTARSFTAELLRTSLGGDLGVDLSQYSDSEMLDSIEYHLFPNMCLFPGISLPMIYRFRPIGMNQGKTLFDLLFLAPLAEGAEAPLPPEPQRVAPHESYASVPGMNPGLGAVYDQDTGNLEMQYRGFEAAKKRGQTLGDYQEIRIRQFHRTIDEYMAR
jgi:phenylpropionate dioxygenase-like ring-hydroxylating dioxygenase large terminal subunit